MTPERVQQLLTTSNLPFLEAIWNTAKNFFAITGLRRHGSLVDIYAEGGLKWIKVSTVPEKRLLMEMAKQGWDWHGMSDSESDEEDECSGDNKAQSEVDPWAMLKENEDDISLVKLAKSMVKAAREKRIKYSHPQVHFVLTRIYSGNKDIDLVLEKIRATGATVQTADQITRPRPINEVIEDLVVDEFKSFSETLNVDCTLLLAIVSDISHGQVKEESWFNKNIRRQIQIEEKEKLMPDTLYPAMAGRDLVCTQIAAQRMREIVDFIGTDSEKARTAIMMGDDASKSPSDLLADFQQFSCNPIPSSWKLPIRVVDPGSLVLSPLAQAVSEQLTEINQSVFLFGWVAGYTTITSNKIATKSIEKAVEENRKRDEEAGPNVWICPTARSLVAKEKDRRDGGSEGLT
jgi:hypothetical protein